MSTTAQQERERENVKLYSNVNLQRRGTIYIGNTQKMERTSFSFFLSFFERSSFSFSLSILDMKRKIKWGELIFETLLFLDLVSILECLNWIPFLNINPKDVCVQRWQLSFGGFFWYNPLKNWIQSIHPFITLLLTLRTFNPLSLLPSLILIWIWKWTASAHLIPPSFVTELVIYFLTRTKERKRRRKKKRKEKSTEWNKLSKSRMRWRERTLFTFVGDGGNWTEFHSFVLSTGKEEEKEEGQLLKIVYEKFVNRT